MAIQGHHIGLQQGSKDALRHLNPAFLVQHHPLSLRLSNPDLADLKSRAASDGLYFEKPGCNVVNLQEFFAKRIDGGICVNEWLAREGYLALKNHPQTPTAHRPGRR